VSRNCNPNLGARLPSREPPVALARVVGVEQGVRQLLGLNRQEAYLNRRAAPDQVLDHHPLRHQLRLVPPGRVLQDPQHPAVGRLQVSAQWQAEVPPHDVAGSGEGNISVTCLENEGDQAVALLDADYGVGGRQAQAYQLVQARPGRAVTRAQAKWPPRAWRQEPDLAAIADQEPAPLGRVEEADQDAITATAIHLEPLLGDPASLTQVARTKVRPYYALMLANRGRYLAMAGEFDGVRAAVDQALALEPASAPLHLLRGELELASGQPDAARQAFAKALQLDPDNREAAGRLRQLEVVEQRSRPPALEPR